MNETVLSAFVIVACLAILIQAGILFGLFLAFRKTSSRLESIAKNGEERTLPLLDSAKGILDDSGPRLKEITTNLAEVSTRLRGQAERMDSTFSDLVDRTHLQVIRVDELVSRTLDKVEETTEMVQSTVTAPVKQMSAIMQGLSVGIGTFLHRRRKAAIDAATAVEDEELFI
jgi:ABC-type transporter Mla subunit MlaD